MKATGVIKLPGFTVAPGDHLKSSKKQSVYDCFLLSFFSSICIKLTCLKFLYFQVKILVRKFAVVFVFAYTRM